MKMLAPYGRDEMMNRSKVDVERMKRKMLQYEEYSAVRRFNTKSRVGIGYARDVCYTPNRGM